jgi:hypothetical protein
MTFLRDRRGARPHPRKSEIDALPFLLPTFVMLLMLLIGTSIGAVGGFLLGLASAWAELPG